MPIEARLSVDLSDRRVHGPRVQRRGARGRPRHRRSATRARSSRRFRCCCRRRVSTRCCTSNTTHRRLRRANAVVGAAVAARFPTGWTPQHAALTEPMAVGLHAVNKSNIQPGETALVIGCGPIGMAIIAALAPSRRRKYRGRRLFAEASRVGDDHGCASGRSIRPHGSPFDDVKPAVVFEAVGVPGIVDDVLRRAPCGTRLVVAGVCMEPDTVHPLFAIAKEINVQFVIGVRRRQSSPSRCARSPRARSTSHR